jgi:hypothetical protein
MTRILLVLIPFIFFSLVASAQFKKNNILLGGQLSYSYNSSSNSQPPGYYSSNDQKVNSGNITISLGKALNENTVIGINLSYLPTSIHNYQAYGPAPLEYQNNGYAVGIFYRKYKSLGKEFYLFGQGSASYNWSDPSGKDSTGKKLFSGSSWSAGIDLFPGIAYRISKHFFLELSIPDLFVASYYKSNTVNQYGTVNEVLTTKNDQFTISTSLSSNPLNALGIGFRLIL